MEIDSIHKYVAINKLANGSMEVMFSGQPCLSIVEGILGQGWCINPVFAKLVYGAHVFQDIPICMESYSSPEEAIAGGLLKLHELGAFKTEYDFPEDSYAATMNTVSEEVKTFALKNSGTISEAARLHTAIMGSIKDGEFSTVLGVLAERSEKIAHDDMVDFAISNALKSARAGKPVPTTHVLRDSEGNKMSAHKSEADAVRTFKGLPSTRGVRIMKEGEHDSDEKIQKTYDEWLDKVQKLHGDVNGDKLKITSNIEPGIGDGETSHTTSAILRNKDKSKQHICGIFCHKENEGKVFPKDDAPKLDERALTPEEEKEKEKIVKELKKDKKFISTYGKDSAYAVATADAKELA
jgi:hypothetical protein